MSGYLQVSHADGDNYANVILIMIMHIFSGCQYFQWMSIYSVDVTIFSGYKFVSVHANAAMKEETLLETKTALHGNQPGDCKHFETL